MKPQIVYNHSLKENAVVTQDVSNKIYYITNNKKFSWTRKLESQIIGNISQGDFFKNKKRISIQKAAVIKSLNLILSFIK